MEGGSLWVSFDVWGSAVTSFTVRVSEADAFAPWDLFELLLCCEGGIVVAVISFSVLLVPAAAVSLSIRVWFDALGSAAASAVLLGAKSWTDRWLSEFDVNVWLSWMSVGTELLLLLLFIRPGSCVVTEESVIAFSVFILGVGFVVHESWSKSGSWWTTTGIGVTWFNPTGSLATWLLVDGWLTALVIADCQLLEQRTAGMLQGETKW